MIFASARLTAVLEVLGRYAPDMPPKSRDFRKVLAYFCELSGTLIWGDFRGDFRGRPKTRGIGEADPKMMVFDGFEKYYTPRKFRHSYIP